MTIWMDARYAIRGLSRPHFATSVALVILIVSIGANIAIFNLVDLVAIQALPAKDPGGVILLSWTSARELPKSIFRQSFGYDRDVAFPFSTFDEIRANCKTCQQVFGSTPIGVGPAKIQAMLDGKMSEVVGEAVTETYFSDLGISPILGRALDAHDARNMAQPGVVIGYNFWVETFGRSASAVGRSIYLNHTPYTIIGVVPAAFSGIQPGRQSAFWVLVNQWSKTQEWKSNDAIWWLTIMVRLKSGIGRQQAQAELQDLFLQRVSSGIQNIKPEETPHIKVEFGGKGLGTLRRELSPYLYALEFFAVLTLVGGCANVAMLMLARTASRRGEYAVRLALGISFTRLIRQLLVESVFLAAAASVIGFILGCYLTRLLSVLMSSLVIRTGSSVDWSRPNWHVFAFTIAIAVLVTLACGLIPAFYAAHVNVAELLKQVDTSSSTSGRRWLFAPAEALVAFQVAICLVLVMSATCFVAAVEYLNNLPLGFQPNHLLLLSVNAASGKEGYEESADTALIERYEQIQKGIRTLPGVSSVSGSMLTPIASWDMGLPIVIQERTGQSIGDAHAFLNLVGADFFETMGIHVLEGHGIHWEDIHSLRRVAVVNENLVRRYLGNGVPIGKHFQFAGAIFEIIGVVENTKYRTITESPTPRIYLPYSQFAGIVATAPAGWNIEVKTAPPPYSLLTPIRETIRRFDPGLSVSNVRTQTEQIDSFTVQQRVLEKVLVSLGLLSLFLSCTAFYGNLSHLLSRRAREFAIRISLGAQPSNVLWLVLRRCLVILTVGLVVGVLSGVAAKRAIAGELYGIQPNTLMISAWSTAVLFVFTCLGCYLAVTNSIRSDPAIVLRSQ